MANTVSTGNLPNPNTWTPTKPNIPWVAQIQPVSTTLRWTTTSTGSSAHSRSTSYANSRQEITHHSVTDDGGGSFGPLGTIDYAARLVTLKLVDKSSSQSGYASDYEDASTFESTSISGNGGDPGGNTSSSKGGENAQTSVGEQLLANSTMQVKYAEGFSTPRSHTQTYRPAVVSIDLLPYTSDQAVPNSIQFDWMGQTYIDQDGVLFRGRSATDAGVVAGRMDYAAGVAEISDYVVKGSVTDFTLSSLWTVRHIYTTASVFMRTQAAPVKPAGITLVVADAHGNQITATAGTDGLIESEQARGRINYEAGELDLQYGSYALDSALTAEEKAEWWYDAADVGKVRPGRIWRPMPVDPTTLRYNSVTYRYLPLDATVIGLDPVRLPPDGRVPKYRAGDYVVVGHTGSIGPVAVAKGQVIDCGRVRLSRAYIVGADQQRIQKGWSVDLEAGLVTVDDATGWAQPVQILHRIEETARLSDVQIDGMLSLTKQLSHAFPEGSIVSSALMAGTLRARVSALFDQETWGSKWQDSIDGREALASYDDTLAPIVVTNAGALTERWMCRFLSSTTFELIGEHVGNLGTFSTTVDCAPINPISDAPYLLIKAIGWKQGWNPGNVVRINTIGAMQSYAAIRTVQPSEAVGTDYRFELLARGSVNRP